MSERSSWWDRLNRILFPYLGPPPLGPGPQGEKVVDAAAPAPRCPLCGEPMPAHTIERTADWSTPTRLHCPSQSAAA
ncbi:MAG: hypothetical protein M3N46_14335 [Actinomycetota bacterium]|nr:hypothetical protein [Actinomycetota bacterium]